MCSFFCVCAVPHTQAGSPTSRATGLHQPLKPCTCALPPSPAAHHSPAALHPRCAVQAPSGAPPHPSRWCAAWMSSQAPPWSSQTCCSSRQPSQVRPVYATACQRRTPADQAPHEAPHPALPAQRLSCCAPCPACHPLHLSLNLYSSSRNPFACRVQARCAGVVIRQRQHQRRRVLLGGVWCGAAGLHCA
jgi:hypothetical protein